jgi:hypothetical protein
MLKRHWIRIGLPSLFWAFILASPVAAQQPRQSAEASRAEEANSVLYEIMNISESAIPEELMARGRNHPKT